MATVLVAGDPILSIQRLPNLLKLRGHRVIDQPPATGSLDTRLNAAVLGIRFSGESNDPRGLHDRLFRACEALLGSMKNHSSVIFVIQRPRFRGFRWYRFLRLVRTAAEYLNILATNQEGIECSFNALVVSDSTAFRLTTSEIAYAVTGERAIASGSIIEEHELKENTVAELVNSELI